MIGGAGGGAREAATVSETEEEAPFDPFLHKNAKAAAWLHFSPIVLSKLTQQTEVMGCKL